MKLTQQEKMKALFEARPFQWIPLYEIFAISKQYNARIFSLRQDGMKILNKIKVVNGERHSWFMYKPHKVEANGQGSFV